MKKHLLTKVASLVLIVTGVSLATLSANAFAETQIPIYGSDYGYGEYTVTTRGVGMDEVADEDTVKFSYVPVTGAATENGDYNVALDLNYTPYDGTATSEGHVAKMVVEVYDTNGVLMSGLTTTVTAPETSITLPFSNYTETSGTYTISIKAYDQNGTELYKAYKIAFNYVAKEPIPVPRAADTGGLLQSLNISQTDYLITGLVIFGLVAIAGLMLLKRKDANKKRAHVSAKRRRK